MTNSRIQGQHRHSFWNEIYETVLAPYIFLPTMLALVNPKFGSFNVTAKGGVVNKTFFDTRIAQPFMLMLGLNVLGLLAALPRYFQFPGAGMPFPFDILARMHDANHFGTIVMNMIWVCFNMVILGVATAVAWESQQRPPNCPHRHGRAREGRNPKRKRRSRHHCEYVPGRRHDPYGT